MKMNILFCFVFILVFQFSCVWSRRTIHISPDGSDTKTCGSNISKCRSINHALEMNTDPDLQLFLESHPSKFMAYEIKRNYSLGSLTSLLIESDVPGSNKNPIMYADKVINGIFSQKEGDPLIELKITFVDLSHIQLFPSDESPPPLMNVMLKISNSTIKAVNPEIDAFLNSFPPGTTMNRTLELYNLDRQQHPSLRLYSDRTGHFLEFFRSEMTLNTVFKIYNDLRSPPVYISNSYLVRASGGLPLEKAKKLFALVTLKKKNLETNNFIVARLIAGSQVMLENCTLLSAGKISIQSPDVKNTISLHLTNSAASGFIQMNFHNISGVAITKCNFHNMNNRNADLVSVSRSGLVIIDLSSVRNSHTRAIFSISDSLFSINYLTFSSIKIYGEDTYNAMSVLAFERSNGTILNLYVTGASSGKRNEYEGKTGRLISFVGSSLKIPTLEIWNTTVENSTLDVFFKIYHSKVKTHDLSIINCSSDELYNIETGSTLALRNATFSRNKAKRIFNARRSSLDVENSKFDENSGWALANCYYTNTSFVKCNLANNNFKLYSFNAAEYSLHVLDSRITDNNLSGLIKVLSNATLVLKKILIKRNVFQENILVVKGSKAIVNETTITENRFKAFVNCLSKSSAIVEKVNYLDNNGTGEGHFAQIVYSKLKLKDTVIFSSGENSKNDLLHLFSSHIIASGTSVHIQKSNSNRIPVFRWLIDAEDAVFEDRINPVQFSMFCPPNYNFHEKRTTGEETIGYEVFCQACKKGTFSFQAGKMFITGEIVKKTTEMIPARMMKDLLEREVDKLFTFNSTKYPVHCQLCPPGGECETSVRSRKNFYGYSTGKTELEFIPCPSGYCCSSERECKTLKSCRPNRTGRLCGQCTSGHQISYATNECFKSAKCDSEQRTIFWITYFVTAIVLAFILSFARIIKAAMKALFVSLKVLCCRTLKKRSTRQSNVELNRIENIPTSNHEIGAENTSPPPPPPIKSYSVSAIFNILVSFYQIKSLIKVEQGSSSKGKLSFIDDIMNLRFQMNQNLNRFCPFINLDTLTKEALRGYGIPFIMVVSLVIMLLLFRCLRVRDRFTSCFYVGFYIVLSFCFKDLSNVALKLTNCVRVEGVSALYISGNVECSGHWWQYANACFIGFWVLPFPISVMLCYSLVRRNDISTQTFLVCLAFPVIAPVVFIYRLKCRKIPTNPSKEKEVVVFNEYAKEHLEEIFEEPYKEEFWWWEIWRMAEKLIVNTLAVFIYDVLTRIYAMTVVLLVLAYFHFQLKPYKKEMVMLYRLDIVSFICLFFQLVVSLIRAFVIVYGSPVKDTFDFHLESVLTPLWYLPLFLIVRAVRAKVKMN